MSSPIFFGIAFYCATQSPRYLQVGPFPTYKRCVDVQTFLAETCPAEARPDRYRCWAIPKEPIPAEVTP